ncbi:unnamed protein product [Eretmochelys imbricata]
MRYIVEQFAGRLECLVDWLVKQLDVEQFVDGRSCLWAEELSEGVRGAAGGVKLWSYGAVSFRSWSYADPVTQPEGAVPVHKGKPVLLNCTFDYAGVPDLYWYEQYPHEAPRLLLTQYEASDEEEKRRRRGFSAKLEKDSKSFHLEKKSSEMKTTHADSVTQPESTVTIHEGKSVLLYCTYDYSGSPVLYWYEQYPLEAPRLLLTQYEASDEEEKRRRRGFSAKLEKDSKSFHLQKKSSEMSDSAVYYCALRDTDHP